MSIEDIEFQSVCLKQADKFPAYFFESGRCRYDERGRPVTHIHDDLGYWHANPDRGSPKLGDDKLTTFNQLLEERFPGREDILKARSRSN